MITFDEDWFTFPVPGDGVAADSLVILTCHAPMIGLLVRDNSGQIWLGKLNLSASQLEVSWRDIGGSFALGPLAQAAGGEIVVMAGAASGELSFITLRGPALAPDPGGWADMELRSAHRPVTESWGPDRIDAFGLADDGILWQSWLQRRDSGWTLEDRPVPIAEEVPEMPTPISWGPLRLDLFGRSQAGSVLHKWWDNAADRFDIFSVENTATTTHKYWHPGTGWLPAPLTQWEDLGGWLTTPPIVVSWAGYHLDIFGRGRDGHLRHLWWGPEYGWEPGVDDWEDMGGVLGGAPEAIAWGRDRLGVFAISIDNTLIFKYRDPGIYWRPSVTRWYESRFPEAGILASPSLRVGSTPEGLAVVAVLAGSQDYGHFGIFRPLENVENRLRSPPPGSLRSGKVRVLAHGKLPSTGSRRPYFVPPIRGD
jgi:hypothetical protein